jgi:hypothetical protein
MILDCYIFAKSLLIMYACFGGSLAREADKIGKKKLKVIMFISYVSRLN